MADIKNKNELKRRINLFLDELDYSINEDFCKETMKMMREFVGHASHRLDCENSKVESLKKKLNDYKDLEKQGLLLRLPIAEGTTVYTIDNNTDACTDCDYFNKGYCCEDYCSMPNIDNDIYPQLSDIPICEKQYLEVTETNPELDWIFRNRDNFGKTVFLTQEEAEQKLKELK